jgi:hypothetical protein
MAWKIFLKPDTFLTSTLSSTVHLTTKVKNPVDEGMLIRIEAARAWLGDKSLVSYPQEKLLR